MDGVEGRGGRGEMRGKEGRKNGGEGQERNHHKILATSS